MARFNVIVKRNLLEVNDTTLVENIFTFFFLGAGELGHIRVIAGGHILMPALFNVLSLQSLFFLDLKSYYCNNES